jgi:type VI secretion system secreted protein VgrG
MAIPGLSAADAIVSIKTKGGDFLVLGMTGHEHLGQMYEYTVELAGALDMLRQPKQVNLQKLLGTLATVKMDVSDDPRYFSGFVTRATRGQKRGRYITYSITLQPWLWFLTRSKNSRVFQDKSVKDIVTDVLKVYSTDSDWRLASESVYPKLDYCVQHNETDFNFVSRLLEEVGIYYFFEHDDGTHTMVLIDKMAKHKSREDSDAIVCLNTMQSKPTMVGWHVQQEARSVKTTLTEYDYLAPTTEIKGEKKADPPPTPGGGLVGSLLGAAGGGDWTTLGDAEWYEHPALVVQNSAKPDTQSASSAASQRATVRMEELFSLYTTGSGTTNARDLGTGMTFELDKSPSDEDNQPYLMVGGVYQLDFADHEAIDDLKTGRKHEGFRCEVLATSKSAPNYRSPRVTPKPVIAGPQTAIVVGASGDEIKTDKHGRIKVQFYWDRDGTNDENSSCWVRVAQPWAGKGYGMFTLPRVGHEVVVQFLDGDPDRPLVTGSVYNADNMVAWKMPDHATVGGIKTQSSKDGSADTANELRFEDKKDSEYIWLRAEKDFFRTVEHDAFDWIGNNESVKVVLTRKEVIGENWFMDITKDVMHNMGKDLHVNVAGDIFYTGGATYQLKLDKDFSAKAGGDFGFDVGGKTQLKSQADIALESSTGKLSLKAGIGDLMAEGMTIKIKGATTVAIEGGVQVSLKAGSSFVDIGPAGVSIVGPMVMINSGGAAGSAGSALSASPTAPTEAKKEDSITAAKKSDYNKTFDDPMPDDDGGSGAASED